MLPGGPGLRQRLAGSRLNARRPRPPHIRSPSTPLLMKELGLFLLLVGVISLALPFINSNIHYAFLTWVDNWGPNVGWAIRGGIVLLGLVLWRAGGRRDA